jgi:hypothetical protein
MDKILNSLITGTTGIITADKSCLKPKHFESVGVSLNIPMVIAGMEEQPEFSSAILKEKGTLDSGKIEKEVVESWEPLLHII